MDVLEKVGDSVSLVKSGEACIEVGIYKSRAGLGVVVNTLSYVEEFIASLGNGDKLDIRTLTRLWVPMRKGENLFLYDAEKLGTHIEGKDYVLGPAGTNLIVPGQSGGLGGGLLDGSPGDLIVYRNPNSKVNLSFLRLVGSSSQGGTSFVIEGPFSKEYVEALQAKMAKALKEFYISYLKPINLAVVVSTQAWTPGAEQEAWKS